MSQYITIGDCSVILQGKNVDKKKLNTEEKGLPYIVGASCLKDGKIICRSYCENVENQVVSHLGDVIVSTVGTLGKLAVNDVGDCVLSRHVCAVRFVPHILPEYGLMCLMGSLAEFIPPDDGTKTGFSRKLDVESVAKCPLLLIGIDKQRETAEKMVTLTKCFDDKEIQKAETDNLPDNPLELAEWLEKKSSALLMEQHRAINVITAVLKEGMKIPENEFEQLTL